MRTYESDNSEEYHRHGRVESRRIEVVSEGVSAQIKWPGISQICRITRTVEKYGKTTTSVSFAITSLPANKYSPEALLKLNRGHWSIENKSHWVRDSTLGEDRSTIRTLGIPQVFSAFRNTTLSLLKYAGFKNMVEGMEVFAEQKYRAIELIRTKKLYQSELNGPG